MCGVFHCVEVIKLAEQFVAAVDGRQELIEIAKVIIAELSGRMTHGLAHGGDGGGGRWQADRRNQWKCPLVSEPLGEKNAAEGRRDADRSYLLSITQIPAQSSGGGFSASWRHRSM